MTSFAHIIYIPFSGVGVGLAETRPTWYRERIEVFKNYTLKSLQNQTNQNFILWLSFAPGYENHPLTAELANYMKDQGVQYFLTFDGLMYWDDKFTPGLWPKALNFARIVRGFLRGQGWRFNLLEDRNVTLGSRLASSLSILAPYFRDVNWVYLTRIDSDDMFRNDVVETIQSVQPFLGAIGMKDGYMYNVDTDEIAQYHPHTNPPFHTIIFPQPIFFDARMHLRYMGGFKSHEDIPKIFKTELLLDGMYCVLTHNPKNHISTGWNHPFRKHIYHRDDTLYYYIRESFGL